MASDSAARDGQAAQDGEAARADHGTPLFSVVRGNPDEAGLAALVAVFTSRAAAITTQPAGQPPAAGPVRSQWAARSRLLREPVRHGPGAWRASGLPR